MNRMTVVPGLVLILLLSGCFRDQDPLAVDVSDIKVPEVKIRRYDLDLFRIDRTDLRNGLGSIKAKYPFFLDTDLNDPAKLEEMERYLANPRNSSFHAACSAKYPRMDEYEASLTEGFRHLRYYFPEATLPVIYTYISGGDYDRPVILADSVLLLAIDCFLGKDNKIYRSDGIPLYRAERMDPVQVVPECMRVMVNSICRSDPPGTLLDQMIEAGKRQYLLQAFLPLVPEEVRMQYTAGQLRWIRKNESHVWAALIENRMLYSSDSKESRIFLSDGPCTQEFGKDSPPRPGEWIGLQIIRSYLKKNPDVSPGQLIAQKDAREILMRSGYKPGK